MNNQELQTRVAQLEAALGNTRAMQIPGEIAELQAEIAEIDALYPGAKSELSAASDQVKMALAAVDEAKRKLVQAQAVASRTDAKVRDLRERRSAAKRTIEDLQVELAGQDRLSRAPIMRNLTVSR